MSWLSNITPPGIKNMFKRRDETPENLWVKCPACGDMIFHRDLEAAQHVCPSCGHHLRIGSAERLAHLFDGGACEEIALPEVTDDPLKFKDAKKYGDRLRDARKKTGRRDVMRAAFGRIEGVTAVALVQDFAFMGGSLGMAAGEGFIRAAEAALEKNCPFIVFTAAGGARMQEGILSLMQMPRTTLAVEMLKSANLPYIVVLTDPTTGGVTASYAMLGDVHLAEPNALIGFAGPRVIEQTIREKLPPGFQRSEYLFEKGMVDLVVKRTDLPAVISRLLRVLMSARKDVSVQPPLSAGALKEPGPAKAAAKGSEPKGEETPPLDKAAE